MKRFLAFLVAALLVFGVTQTAHAVTGPPGTVCTLVRYGKGGGRTCIRWVAAPTTTTTTTTP